MRRSGIDAPLPSHTRRSNCNRAVEKMPPANASLVGLAEVASRRAPSSCHLDHRAFHLPERTGDTEPAGASPFELALVETQP